MLAALLALVAAALPPVSPLDSPPPARRPTPGLGRVLQVTGARAYLDAGADDGLAVGQALALRRGAAEAGSCTVESVGPGSATCTGGTAKAGDTFKLAPPPSSGVKAVTLPPPPSEAEQERRAAAVATAPVPLVAWKAAGPAMPALAPPRANLAEVALGDAFWSTTGLANWDVVRLDASVHGAPVGPLTLDLDVRAEQWLAQGTEVFRPGDDTRLYVWQAQLAYDSPDGRLNLAAGRILPWTVPGATVTDGALVGVRRGAWTVGAFGGLVPEPDTIYPTTTRATAGGFWSLDQRFGQSVMLRQEGRLAWTKSPELGNRLELEADAALQVGPSLDLFAAARLAAGGTVKPPAGVDMARVELGGRPLAKLSLTGGFEYGGTAVPWVTEPPAFGTRSRRADLTVLYEVGPVRLGASGGSSHDDTSGLDRTWVGPEVQVPRFFSPRVSLSAGYLQEMGWLNGQSAWLSTVARPWDPLRLIARVSWTHQANLAIDQDEVGLSLAASAELTRSIGLRLSVLGRAGLNASGAGSVPFGLSASASVYAQF